MSLQKCRICHNRYDREDLIINKKTGTGLCVQCVTEGWAKGGKDWYLREMGETREDFAMTLKVDISRALWCPKCSNYSWDEKTKRCVTNACVATERDITESIWLRQRIEFSKHICPFCLGLKLDLDNQICLNCKSHLSKKSMLKRHRKMIRKRKAVSVSNIKDPEDKGYACTICGGINVWAEIGYCHSCRQTYRIRKPGTSLFALVDGLATYNKQFVYFKVCGGTRAKPEIKSSYGVPIERLNRRLNEILKTKRGDLMRTGASENEVDTCQTGGEQDGMRIDDGLVRIESEEFNDLPWKEVELTIPAKALVKVRYVDEDPENFSVESFTLDNFDPGILKKIPGFIKKLDPQEGKK